MSRQDVESVRRAMRFNELPIEKPNFRRWFAFRRRTPKATILRALQYEALEACKFSGHVLDYGGGRRATYKRFIESADEITSVNLDEEFAPTHIVKVGQALPFADNSFEHVVCLNVLEHVYDALHMMREIHRVLKPNGTAIISTPFVYRVHAHPDDFNRFTAGWFKETCERLGYGALEITPLTWGRFSTAQLIYGNVIFFGKNAMMFKDLLISKVFCPFSRFYTGRLATRMRFTAAGYFVCATK